ncbi:MAG: amidohydrolase family protein, partial [Bacteroidetes bacterium]|nr:amidohydrolase family protein [Bacteroidota bacterium]
LDGQNPAGWVPEQKISVEEALRAYTIGASFAGFSEKSVGSLQSGYLADIVILDRDILAEPVDSLGSARIRTTISNGKVVYNGAR